MSVRLPKLASAPAAEAPPPAEPAVVVTKLRQTVRDSRRLADKERAEKVAKVKALRFARKREGAQQSAREAAMQRAVSHCEETDEHNGAPAAPAEDHRWRNSSEALAMAGLPEAAPIPGRSVADMRRSLVLVLRALQMNLNR